MNWTKVEDGLPKRGHQVLTYGLFFHVIGYLDVGGAWNAVTVSSDTGKPWLRPAGVVTHWMEPPSLPGIP